MEASSDVMDILELTGNDPYRSGLFAYDSAKKKKSKKLEIKRPEGMHRELWGLLWTDNMDAPPIVPTESTQGYKSMKAKLGITKVRPWGWIPFYNQARKDGAVFYHWRRKADEGKEYPFAAFNKAVDVVSYTDTEYQQYLVCEDWTKAETDHLVDLAKRFDLRFVVMHDRWNTDKFLRKSIEDLKERYYNMANLLLKARSSSGHEPRMRMFDADHERRRKQQLINLYDRSEEQVAEEQELLAELKKIETRKREREKKTADLQKLISAAEMPTDQRKIDRKQSIGMLIPKKKHTGFSFKRESLLAPDKTGIKFIDTKQSGVTLRSHRLKVPSSVNQKKLKAIEQVLDDLGIEQQPIPTEDVITNFNELRQDIVLLYELKSAMSNCEYELQTLKHRLESLVPEQKEEVPAVVVDAQLIEEDGENSQSSLDRKTSISDTFGLGGTPNKKRKAAIEQSNILKKIKQKF